MIRMYENYHKILIKICLTYVEKINTLKGNIIRLNHLMQSKSGLRLNKRILS